MSKDVRAYIKDIEKRSGLKVNHEQRQFLKEASRAKKYKELTPAEKAKHSKVYKRKSTQDKMMEDWEKNTGQKWPTYKETIYSKNGKILKNPGDRHDIHHIIPKENGGPHEWWNAHPLEFPKHHQGGVHGKGAPLGKILKEMKSEK